MLSPAAPCRVFPSAPLCHAPSQFPALASPPPPPSLIPGSPPPPPHPPVRTLPPPPRQSGRTDGDSNFLFDQSVSDVSASYIEPHLEGLLRASIAENSVELHLPLLLGVPHLARAGDADMTVHPFWARRAVRLLEAAEAVEGEMAEEELPPPPLLTPLAR